MYYDTKQVLHTGWRTKCHTIDCTYNTFLLLQKHLTSGIVLILTGWKIVPNEEHVQCYHRFASQPLANEPLHSSQLFDTSLQRPRGTTSLCGTHDVAGQRPATSWVHYTTNCNTHPSGPIGPDGLFVSQRTGSHSAGIHVPFTNCFVCRWFCVVHDPKPPLHSHN